MSVVPSLHHPQQATPLLAIAAIALTAGQAFAGQYAPAAGNDGSTAVYKDAAFAGWATKVVNYTAGANVEDEWKDTSLCLGKAGTDIYDITCLGNGGAITLGFDSPVANGDGWDFAVFENGFGPGFLELAYVEVSSDGIHFVRFPSHSETPSAVGAYTTTMDATNIDGLASKYQVGYGTPFDLSDLAGVAGVDKVDLNNITQIRLVDIIGDGSCKDSSGNPVYDPYPCIGSGGFDLDAIGARYFSTTTSAGNQTLVSTDAQNIVDDISVELSGENAVIKWPGDLGSTYKVETSGDLKTWTVLKSGIEGKDATMILTIAAPASETFYSVTEE
jgi:hypothetical protein